MLHVTFTKHKSKDDFQIITRRHLCDQLLPDSVFDALRFQLTLSLSLNPCRNYGSIAQVL